MMLTRLGLVTQPNIRIGPRKLSTTQSRFDDRRLVQKQSGQCATYALRFRKVAKAHINDIESFWFADFASICTVASLALAADLLQRPAQNRPSSMAQAHKRFLRLHVEESKVLPQEGAWRKGVRLVAREGLGRKAAVI